MSHVSIVGELNHKIQRAKENLFTGILAIGTNTEVEWFLYFLVGQIVWANTRTHSQRRWQRQFLKYSSELNPKTLNEIIHHPHNNYQTMAKLVMQQRFKREQFSQIVIGCISEVLFDIIHQATLSAKQSKPQLIYKASARNGANFPCIGLHREPVWDQVQQDWQAWQDANLVDYCPNLSPKVIQADILQERISQEEFKNLKRLATGKETLRDLSVKTGQPLISLTQSLVPHIRRDLIKLVDTNERPVGVHSQQRSKLERAPEKGSKATGVSTATVSPSNRRQSGLIGSKNAARAVVAYVDDNPADSQAMADIFAGSQYRYVNIPDPLQALPKLLELKPQLIFLDLVMPVVNGYELCAQIRRVSAFKDVPIIIMTNNNSIPDRVRAKVVGSTAFLGKPIQPKRVLKVVLKHLQSEPAELLSPVHFHSRLLQSV